MSDNRLGNRICFHLFECFAINCRAASLPNDWDAQVIIEQRMQVRVRSPVEVREADAVEYDPLKVPFKRLDLVMEFLYDFGFSSKINSYSPQSHLKRRSLEFLGEPIGCGSMIIQLWKKDVENFRCNTTVQPVVDLISFPLGGGIIWSYLCGVDDSHASRLIVVSVPLRSLFHGP